MARTRTDSNESVTPLRLRIPPSLAIAVLGGAASLALSFVACEESPIPPPPADAGQIEKRDDAGPDTSFAQEEPLADATIARPVAGHWIGRRQSDKPAIAS